MVVGQGRGNFRSGNQSFRGAQTTPRLGSSGNKKFGKSIQKGKPRRVKYNPNVSYTFCRRTWHVMDDYFRLIGFPDDFEFTKGKNVHSFIKENTVVTWQESEDFSSGHEDSRNLNNKEQHPQFLSKEQHSNMIHQVRMDMKNNQASTSTPVINAHTVAGLFNEERASFW